MVESHVMMIYSVPNSYLQQIWHTVLYFYLHYHIDPTYFDLVFDFVTMGESFRGPPIRK